MDALRRASILLILLMVRPVVNVNSTQGSTTKPQTTTDPQHHIMIIISMSSLAGFSSCIIVVFLVVSCLRRMRRGPGPNQVVYLERPQASNTQQLSSQGDSTMADASPHLHPLAQFYPQPSLSADPLQSPLLPLDRFHERHQCRCHMLPASYEDIGRRLPWGGYHYSRDDLATPALASAMTSAGARQLKASRRLSRSVPDLSLPRNQPFSHFPRMPELPDETIPTSPRGGPSKKFRTMSRERDARSDKRRLAEDVTANVAGLCTYTKNRVRYSHERETNVSQWLATRGSNISDLTTSERASNKTSCVDDVDQDYVAMSSTQALSQSPSQKKADASQTRPGQQRAADGRTSSHVYQNLPCLSSKPH